MPFYVYIILCRGGSFYTGYTQNVEERAKLHANGRGSKYTKMYPPKKVAYVEQLSSRPEAMKRERAIKKFSHQQKQDLINCYKLKLLKEKNLLKIEKSTDKNNGRIKIKRIPDDKPTWNDKLNEKRDLPRIEPINERMSVKWGKGTLVIPAPMEVDQLMRKVPQGKVTTINEIRTALARKHGATISCPITTGIFSWIAAQAAHENAQRGGKEITPYWRTLKTGGFLNEKYPGGAENQKRLLENEGHIIVSKGKKYVVLNYGQFLV